MADRVQGDTHVTDAGAGKLNAGDAVKVAVTLEPAAISFGAPATLPVNRNLTITNVSSAAATLHAHRSRTDPRIQFARAGVAFAA